MPEKTDWKLMYTEVKSCEYDDELMKHWQYQDESLMYHVFARYFFCNWGPMKQVTIGKEALESIHYNSKEPSMCEKRKILSELEIFKSHEVALEIFPKKSKIVDRFDLYHIWILEQNNFPYYIESVSIPRITKWKSVHINGKKLKYKRKEIKIGSKKSEVYFLKAENGLELVWYDKQNFKDDVIGENVVAVEYISDSANITTLICVPKDSENFPFGLMKTGREE